MVVGLGLLRLGVPPGSEEVGRAFFFLLATLGYAGVWLALGLLFSVLFRQPATAALAALGVWLFFAVFYPILTDLAANALLLRADPFDPESQLRQAQLALWISRLSPNTLYAEALTALLNPAVRSLGPILITQLEGAVLGTPFPSPRASSWSGPRSRGSSPSPSSSSPGPTWPSSGRRCGREAGACPLPLQPLRGVAARLGDDAEELHRLLPSFT